MALRKVRSVGERALLVECADLAEVMALHAELIRHPLVGQVDLLSAARTVLVVAENSAYAQTMRDTLAALPAPRATPSNAAPITINVVYDGIDLDEVAALLGLSRDALIAAHTGELWMDAFNGFVPGFAYCVSETQMWQVPRRPTPRTQVPAGAVALAGEFSAVYPKTSPGGWQLIGHTDAVLWDLSREHPALLNPGDKVKYVAVRESLPLNPTSQHPHLPPFQRGWQAKPDGGLSPAPQQTPAGTAYLEIITPGWLALIEDGGRPGMLGLGVSVSGAADQSALRAANLALGNPPTTAAIETLGGLELLAHGTVTVAVAPPAAPVQVMQLSDGDTLQVPTPTTGVRSYVAVAGGIAVLPVLGNCSTDLLSGIGPAPLRAGDVLLLANPQQKPPNLPTPAPAPPTAETLIRITLGPRDDWLTATALASLTEQIWEVSNESNRVGLRLIGEPLQRAITRELPSEGTQPGAIQVPPNGLPVVFLRDHPVTGGYPVVAVVAEEDLDILAQTRPAENLRFVVA